MISGLIKLCGISENNASYSPKGISFVEGNPDFEKPENKHMLRALDDFTNSAYSKTAN